MRITNSMMLNSMMRNMGNNLSRMNKTEQMVATGKKFSLPSDDPIGVSRSMRLNTEIASLDQYKRNAEDALSWLETSETAVTNLTTIFHRAKELTKQAENETNTAEERSIIATEMKELKNQVIGLANTTYAGSYIFAGFKTDKPLMDAAGLYLPTALSNNETIEFNIGIADKMAINILPQNLFGNTAGGQTADQPNDAVTPINPGNTPQMIKVFDDLITGLNSNLTADIKLGSERLDKQFKNLNTVKTAIGVKTNRLELTVSRINEDTVNMTGLLAKNEDVDMAEAIMNLKMQESVYQASLSTGARIIQPTLIDFLR